MPYAPFYHSEYSNLHGMPTTLMWIVVVIIAIVIFFCVCNRKKDSNDDCGACGAVSGRRATSFAVEDHHVTNGLIDVRDNEELNDLIGMSNDGCGCVVWFMAPWCGHCHEMKEEFEKAAHMHAQDRKSPPYCKVDCDQVNDSARLHNIQGFPTIRHYKDGHITAEYSGPREASHIFDWVKSKIDNALSI